MIGRIFRQAVFVPLTLALAGCGGGGGSNGNNTAFTQSVNLPFVTVTICVPGSGVAPPPGNVLPMVVDGGPSGAPNVPQAQTSASCQTIDHILVDTASSGLRIISSVLNAPLRNLPPQKIGADNLAECMVFADGFSWGSVRLADVYVAGESASSIPVQIIGDSAFPAIPPSCSSLGVEEDTVQTFGSNGILGVSTFAQDCGPLCQQSASPGSYYICPSSSCQPVSVPMAQQVPNPVTKFASDANGVVLALPAIAPSGAASVTGTLTFGIGTQSNNALAGATIYDVDTVFGNFTTAYNGQNFTDSAFLDSGSNALYFPDPGIPVCGSNTIAPGFYCPNATLFLSATIRGFSNGHASNVNFSVANANALLSAAPTFAAFDNIAATQQGSFDWGLPFFYGRTVFFAIEAPSGSGPYVAY
jgi:hypothetical protein